jgi:hypothetical protein
VLFCGDFLTHAGGEELGCGGCGKGFHVPCAVLVSPVGVPLAGFVAHGDWMETGLLRGLFHAGFGGFDMYPEI